MNILLIDAAVQLQKSGTSAYMATPGAHIIMLHHECVPRSTQFTRVALHLIYNCVLDKARGTSKVLMLALVLCPFPWPCRAYLQLLRFARRCVNRHEGDESSKV